MPLWRGFASSETSSLSIYRMGTSLRCRLPFASQNRTNLARRLSATDGTGPDDYLHAETFDEVAYFLWQRRTELETAREEVILPLDALLDFTRSDLDDYESIDYRTGFGEPFGGGGYERFAGDRFNEIIYSIEEESDYEEVD